MCVPPSVPGQCRCLDSSCADVAEVSGVMGKSGRGCGWQLELCVLCAQISDLGSWVLTLLYFPEVVLQPDCFCHSCFSPGCLF